MNRPPYNNRKRGPDSNLRGFTEGFTIPRKQFKDDQNNIEYQRSESVNNSYEDYSDYQPNYPGFHSHGPPNSFPETNRGYPSADYDNYGNFTAPPSPNQFNFRNKQFRGNQHFQGQQNRYREVPKTGNGTPSRYHDTFPHSTSDPTLPKELTEQFQPLYCKLCSAQLSSNVMAKLHYKSKNHEKKVRKFLTEYSERTGEPLHEMAKVVNSKKQKPDEDKNPKYFHCDVCDLPLTGRLHAESHYMGKNHQRALSGKTPAGRGHYDIAGNWIRTTPTVPSERDTFGLDFVPSKPKELTDANIAITNEVKSKTVLQCELCEVSVTSEQQMTMHINGQKHKKKVEQQERDKEEENKTEEVQPDDSILSSLSCSSISSADLSVYRTPTGYYYCNPCNLSLNSETQFKQHLTSKKHRKKASTSKEQNV